MNHGAESEHTFNTYFSFPVQIGNGMVVFCPNFSFLLFNVFVAYVRRSSPGIFNFAGAYVQLRKCRKKEKYRSPSHQYPFQILIHFNAITKVIYEKKFFLFTFTAFRVLFLPR